MNDDPDWGGVSEVEGPPGGSCRESAGRSCKLASGTGSCVLAAAVALAGGMSVTGSSKLCTCGHECQER